MPVSTVNRGGEMSLILSIKSKYAAMIYDGTKTIELRLSVPRDLSGTIYLYETAPVKSITGSFKCYEFLDMHPRDLWYSAKDETGISYQDYCNYFSGYSRAYGLLIEDVSRFLNPTPLAKIKQIWAGFNPPQSFRYIDDAKTDGLSHIAGNVRALPYLEVK
jgi:Uncharacterized conserved protein